MLGGTFHTPQDTGSAAIPAACRRSCDNEQVLRVDLLTLREAMEASWDSETSYQGVIKPNNPAYGQCYPTARVVQYFFPATEVAEGEVWTGTEAERHFWNLLEHDGAVIHIDLSWQQFPIGSSVASYDVRDRSTFADSPETLSRVEILLSRVMARLRAS